MCGRYLFTSPLDAVQQMFNFDQMTNLGPNYNVAPTHEMPIVRREQGDRRNELAIARWGLIPHWAKDEARMAKLIAADPELTEIDRRLRTVPGVGAIVAATLITELPEPGRLDRRRIAALAGLAPIARDSGKRIGRRRIGGGRPVVRTMLYIAALHASRRCPTFQSFRARLERTGKPAKVAITATARKPLGILNAMIAKHADYRLAAPG